MEEYRFPILHKILELITGFVENHWLGILMIAGLISLIVAGIIIRSKNG